MTIQDMSINGNDAASGIIKILNAAATAKNSQTDFQKEILLHQLDAQQKRQEKQQEMQDQMAEWGKMLGADNPTNSSGIANSSTPNKVASSPISPVAPIGGDIPQGGYTADNPPPMSMADGSNQPQIQQMQAQAQQTPVQQPQNLPPVVKTQLEQEMGFVPTKIPRFLPEMGPNGPSLSSNKDYIGVGEPYNQILNKNSQGIPLTPGEIAMVKSNTKNYKDTGSDLFPGIDTVNSSPEEIGQQLQAKDPVKYRYLESLKDGKINIAGRTSKDLQKDMERVQGIWPGTDMTVVKARMDVRKDFTSGPTSKIVDALNTSLLHGDTASDLIKKVNNRGLLIGNTIGNILKTQTNDPDLLVLKDTIEKYNRESAKAIAGSGQVYADELKNNNDQLNAAQSVDGALGIIKNRTKLFSGRTTPLAERWQRTFGEDSPAPVLGPHAQKLLAKNGFQYDSNSGEITEGNMSNNSKTYGGLTTQQAREQGYTGWDSDNNKWVK